MGVSQDEDSASKIIGEDLDYQASGINRSNQQTMDLNRGYQLEKEMKNFQREAEEKCQALMRIQGLLSQFWREEIRLSFLNGSFGVKPNCVYALKSVLTFKRILLPQPLSVDLNDKIVEDFTGRLLSRDKSEPRDEKLKLLPYRQTFSDWYTFFQTLLTSPAWSGILSENAHRCQPQPQAKFSLYDGGDSQESHGHVGYTGKNYDSSEKGVRPKHRNRIFVRSPVAQDSVSSKSASSTEQRSSSSSSQTEEGSCEERRRKPRRKKMERDSDLIRILAGLKNAKEVIPPVPFNPTDCGSLRRFLCSFEKYIDSRYDSTDKEKAAQLAKYLRGSAKIAYDAMAGSSMRFSQLKPMLIDWYRSQQGDGYEARRSEFANARKQEGESFGIFCLRLERLASRLFQRSSREYDRELQLKLNETASPELLGQLEAAQSTLSVTGGGKLTWSRIKRLMESFVRKTS